MSYDSRVENQIDQYRDLNRLKKLPPIYSYWSQKHLVPIIQDVFGERPIFSVYAQQFARAMMTRNNSRRVLSIGAGDCKGEIAIAKKLRDMRIEDFVIDCTELSGIRLERGRLLAEQEGVTKYLEFLEVDLNNWETTRKYAGVMAHHTLHHIVELETLFENILRLMDDNGVFMSVDMIGRNGHMRWPETLQWCENIWAFLPERFKFNHQFGRLIDPYENWDCSKKGFEGIRAQDILPLLLRHFSFTHFVAVGGIVDVFVERGFGHNFDVEDPADTAFIDFLHGLNETLIDSGNIKPTMMFAAMRKKHQQAEIRFHKNRSPQFAVRDPSP